jgi:glycosyl transferase family 2
MSTIDRDAIARGAARRPRAKGISVVIPVRNGERWLSDVLAAILEETHGLPAEIIVVDDGSTDDTRAILAPLVARGRVRVLDGAKIGAAAALNLGIRHARYDVIAQIDQDVIVERGWLARVLAPLAERGVAASQGWYRTPRDASVWARVMGLDLEQRYRRLGARYLDHVCTGNTAYDADALHAIALFDESLGYGYDNDVSYRLAAAGYRLAFARDARATHRWRDGFFAYVRQQYGVGYGRLDVIGKHPARLTGDDVSGAGMIAHAAAMTLALASIPIAFVVALSDGPWTIPLASGALVVLALAIERAVAGAGAAVRAGDAAGLLFAPVHLARDVAWSAAVVVWGLRRLARRTRRPEHSMRAH